MSQHYDIVHLGDIHLLLRGTDHIDLIYTTLLRNILKNTFDYSRDSRKVLLIAGDLVDYKTLELDSYENVMKEIVDVFRLFQGKNIHIGFTSGNHDIPSMYNNKKVSRGLDGECDGEEVYYIDKFSFCQELFTAINQIEGIEVIKYNNTLIGGNYFEGSAILDDINIISLNSSCDSNVESYPKSDFKNLHYYTDDYSDILKFEENKVKILLTHHPFFHLANKQLFSEKSIFSQTYLECDLCLCGHEHIVAEHSSTFIDKIIINEHPTLEPNDEVKPTYNVYTIKDKHIYINNRIENFDNVVLNETTKYKKRNQTLQESPQGVEDLNILRMKKEDLIPAKGETLEKDKSSSFTNVKLEPLDNFSSEKNLSSRLNIFSSGLNVFFSGRDDIKKNFNKESSYLVELIIENIDTKYAREINLLLEEEDIDTLGSIKPEYIKEDIDKKIQELIIKLQKMKEVIRKAFYSKYKYSFLDKNSAKEYKKELDEVYQLVIPIVLATKNPDKIILRYFIFSELVQRYSRLRFIERLGLDSREKEIRNCSAIVIENYSDLTDKAYENYFIDVCIEITGNPEIKVYKTVKKAVVNHG